MSFNAIRFMVWIVPSDDDSDIDGREVVIGRTAEVDTEDQARDYVAGLLSHAWQVRTVVPICEITAA